MRITILQKRFEEMSAQCENRNDEYRIISRITSACRFVSERAHLVVFVLYCCIFTLLFLVRSDKLSLAYEPLV